MRARSSLIEMAVILAGALLAAFWLIPAQTTTDPGSSLQPATLPMLCALAIAALAVAMARPGRRRAAEAAPAAGTDWRALCLHVAIIALGIAALRAWGPLAVPFAVMPPMMLCLGERKPLRIVAGTLIVAAPLGWLAT